MKKYTHLFFLITTFILFSCSDDIIVRGTNSTASIVGEWEMTSYQGTSNATTTILGQPTTITSSSVGKNYDFTLSFTENPNIVTPKGGFDIEITAVIAGIPNTQTVPATSDNFEGTWSINGDKLMIQPSNNTVPFDDVTTITELTDTTLKLNIIVQTEETIQGITATIDNNINVEFKRN